MRNLYQKVLDSHLGYGKESRAASEAGVILGKVPATLEPSFNVHLPVGPSPSGAAHTVVKAWAPQVPGRDNRVLLCPFWKKSPSPYPLL